MTPLLLVILPIISLIKNFTTSTSFSLGFEVLNLKYFEYDLGYSSSMVEDEEGNEVKLLCFCFIFFNIVLQFK